MDLTQRKLTRSEWNSIEIIVEKKEQDILHMISNGYNNPDIIHNVNLSILNYLKLEYCEEIEQYIFKLYFIEPIKKQIKKYKITDYDIDFKFLDKKIKLKKTDQIRFEQNTANKINEDNVFEHIMLFIISKLLKYFTSNNNRWHYYFYSLINIQKNNIGNINKYFISYVEYIINKYTPFVQKATIISKSLEYIEKNEYIFKYKDDKLYQHQKDIYTIFKTSQDPKLVLYIAPTATGKTLTPIGLSNEYRIIFVCAARHVGISLAKSAISMKKKVAFAFGCQSKDDIRLHYYSSSKYFKHELIESSGNDNSKEICSCRNPKCKKIGQFIKYKDGSKKIDNSVGDKVEIMICDIKSYLYAMEYMLQFNVRDNMIMFWDEPTITLDYENHECHETIKKNWSKNVLPNIVLSSATLPKEDEINDVIVDFKNKHSYSDNSKVYSISSDDCKKTIPIINHFGFVELPHLLYEDFSKMKSCVQHCFNYKTLLRYFDLHEVSRFITYINLNKLLDDEQYYIETVFNTFESITMETIKENYLNILNNISENKWPKIYEYFKNERTLKIQINNKEPVEFLKKSISVDQPPVKNNNELKRMNSYAGGIEEKRNTFDPKNGTFITTKDAYTLTDGPTIYLAENVEKIGKFCLLQANIPTSVMKEVETSIEFNNKINEKIIDFEKQIDDRIGVLDQDSKKDDNLMIQKDKVAVDLYKKVDGLKKLIKSAKLNDIYVPNTLTHIKKWTDIDTLKAPPFRSTIDDEDIIKIMEISDIDDIWKILLLLGIGLFCQNKSIAYTELVKEFAYKQKLYLIIANGDYIYGTNYQFCHGYISKDLIDITQEKIIQAMGRIGRNKIQQNYTVRFREDKLIERLFQKEENKKEVKNMNKLFKS